MQTLLRHWSQAVREPQSCFAQLSASSCASMKEWTARWNAGPGVGSNIALQMRLNLQANGMHCIKYLCMAQHDS